MESKLFVFYFLIFANFQVIYGQNEYLGCNYQIFNSQYTCMLTIYNPNGLNNFQRIGGTHMILRNDSDVISIWRQSGSNTKNIPSILCNTFRNAQIMYLHQIGIESIDDYSFANCSKLGYVNVNDNKVFHIAENAFQWNSYIGGLELKNNQIKSLGENTFVNLQSLKYLWISSNNITDLPSGIFSHLKSLESLTLGNNQISILKPEWFEILEIIEELDLSSNRIEQIPRNTFSSMKILRVITLDNNKLKVIRSDSFSMHPELRFLELQFNQIDAIDENIIYNTAAREIYMEGNLCANLTVYDNTTSREIFRYYLGRCFYNFNQLPVGESKLLIIFIKKPIKSKEELLGRGNV